MSSRHLQDILKMSWRRLEDVWPRETYWSWSRGLQDALKASSEDECERLLHQDECLLGDIFCRRFQDVSLS